MFQNRQQAGELLAAKLKDYQRKEVVVLGIPRGGVVVASAVAEFLQLPLDIIVIKKIGAPNNPELAVGAVAGAKIIYWDNRLCRQLSITKSEKLEVRSKKLEELREREKLLRGEKKYNNFENKTVILVDDGVATGATAIAAGKFVKKMKAKKIILATTVIAKDTLLHIKRYFDEVIFLESPEEFHAVGQFYQDFPQVGDEEVKAIL